MDSIGKLINVDFRGLRTRNSTAKERCALPRHPRGTKPALSVGVTKPHFNLKDSYVNTNQHPRFEKKWSAFKKSNIRNSTRRMLCAWPPELVKEQDAPNPNVEPTPPFPPPNPFLVHPRVLCLFMYDTIRPYTVDDFVQERQMAINHIERNQWAVEYA